MKTLLFFVIIQLFYVNSKSVIYIQPIDNVNKTYINTIKSSLESFYNIKCIINTPISGTKDIHAKIRTNRYDAQKMLDKYQTSNHTVLVTEKDICYTKTPSQPEWGIFGLAKRNSNICVVSVYRLKHISKNLVLERINKISIHEVGHNFGLDHCTNNSKCLMSSAKGTIKQIDQESTYFCDICKSKLINKRL